MEGLRGGIGLLVDLMGLLVTWELGCWLLCRLLAIVFPGRQTDAR